jgi:hypothetical protein
MSTTAHFIDHGQHSIIKTRGTFDNFDVQVTDSILQIKLFASDPVASKAGREQDPATVEFRLDRTLAKKLAEHIRKRF